MSDNQGKKLKLNLNAKEFKPKSFGTQNQPMMQPQNQGMMPNPYMQYGMGGQYDYMYQNQFMMPSNPYEGYNQGFMNQPQINPNFQPPQPAPQPPAMNPPKLKMIMMME